MDKSKTEKAKKEKSVKPKTKTILHDYEASSRQNS